MTELGKAIQSSAAEAGVTLSDEQVQSIETGVNRCLGRESNEGEKQERRKAAVEEAYNLYQRRELFKPAAYWTQLDSIIEKAQG